MSTKKFLLHEQIRKCKKIVENLMKFVLKTSTFVLFIALLGFPWSTNLTLNNFLCVTTAAVVISIRISTGQICIAPCHYGT